jgi:beta-galactosidase GanA
VHAEGATVLAEYGSDFHAGNPALTRHRFGAGNAYFVASRNDGRFRSDFQGGLATERSAPGISGRIARRRHGANAHRWLARVSVFAERHAKEAAPDRGVRFQCQEFARRHSGGKELELDAYGVLVLERGA